MWKGWTETNVTLQNLQFINLELMQNVYYLHNQA